MTVPHLTIFRLVLELTETGGVTTPGPAIRGKPDALIDRDALGRPHIPGTSLAGALQERARTVAGSERDELVAQLFGRVAGPRARDQDKTVRADGTVDADESRLWIMNAELAPDNPEPEVMTRWSTAISRERGAARLHTLRGVETLPVGTAFVIRLWLEGASDEMMKLLCDALTGWEPLLGRGVSTGHGRAKVTNARYGSLNLGTREDLLLWLETDGPGLVDKVTLDPDRSSPLSLSTPDGDAERWWILEATITGPLWVGKAKSDDIGASPDMATTGQPVQDTVQHANEPVVPGTSIKGVLRSRCEFILNTVGIFACSNQRCGSCPTCGWFGHGGGDDESAKAVGARSRIRIPDAIVRGAQRRNRTHIAIDRWTGSVAQHTPTDAKIHEPGDRGGQLYPVSAIECGSFAIQLSPERHLVGDERADPAEGRFLAVLALVVDDINSGLVAFGAATTRGYGGVVVRPRGDWLPDAGVARRLLKDWSSEEGAVS